MRHEIIKFKVENVCVKRDNLAVFILEVIPAITFRYVKGDFGMEINLYISWLVWSFSVIWHDTE